MGTFAGLRYPVNTHRSDTPITTRYPALLPLRPHSLTHSDTYLEEGSGCNIFIVSSTQPSPSPSRAAAAATTPGDAAAPTPCISRARVRISTPPAAGSILPGINRASLLELGEVLGYEVCEEPITVADAMQVGHVYYR